MLAPTPESRSSAASLIFRLDSGQPGCRRGPGADIRGALWVGAGALAELSLLPPRARWDAIDFQEEVGSVPSLLFTPPFIFIAFLLPPPSLPPSTLWCVCPLLSAAPDKQTAAFAWRRRHLLPQRKAGEGALIPLALGSSSSLLHAPPHLKSIAPRTLIPPPLLYSLLPSSYTSSSSSSSSLFPPDSHSSCDHNL